MVGAMPTERFVADLNAQIAREFAAAHQYTAIAAWYEAEAFPQLARFFYDQAEEEREHGMKMVRYLLDTDSRVEFGQIDAARSDFADHVEPIALALEQERQVTVHISRLFEVARETNDFTSEQFLHWFLEEQVEEESTMSDLLKVAERTREIPTLLEEHLARDAPGD